MLFVGYLILKSLLVIVPSCYRVHFPPAYKSKNHMDVVCVCRECHEDYEYEHADDFKNELALQYNAPMHGVTERNHFLEHEAHKAAKAIHLHSDKIPLSRQKELIETIEKYLGNFSAEEIKELASRKIQYTTLIETHGEIVVKQIEDLPEFIIMWRKHFVNSTNPKFMPLNWSVDGPVCRNQE